MGFDTPAVTFALALTSGMLAQVVARHLRIPGIVMLLVAGVVLGPDGAGLIRPDTLGPALRIMVAASVAVILFEGGLHLEISRLRREGPTIRRLVTLGALITGVGAAISARLLMAWPWAVAVPFGTLVVVTGPTVIAPLLRRIRVNQNLHTILEAEGVLIDPIGAILAVVALEVVLAQELSSAAQGLIGIPTRLVFGTLAGAAGGLLMGKLLQWNRAVPEGLESITTLALLLGLHSVAEAILPESGIMAAPIAGVVMGNMPMRPDRELREFKQQLSVLLVGLLFVLLAADVRLAEVTSLGWRGWATVGVLMLIIRPINVLVCTHGSALNLRERTFLAWLGPRGIVAAAVASVFADQLVREGVPEGLELRALVFLVIATTVVVQGLTGGALAAALKVRRRTESGFVIAGANALARAVAHSLRAVGEEAVLIDSDPAEVAAAREAGLQAVLGSALDDTVLEEADVNGRRAVMGIIGNDATSLLFADKARREYRVPAAFLALRPRHLAVSQAQGRRLGARMLFGRPVSASEWSRRIANGDAQLASYRYGGSVDQPLAGLLEGAVDGMPDVLFLTIEHRGRALPVDELSRLLPGDTAFVLQGRSASLTPPFEPRGLPSEPAAS
jgi:NhaP-type Na+/H+ or K+/H+ antiporter